MPLAHFTNIWVAECSPKLTWMWTPAAQDNIRAEYIVTRAPVESLTKRYQIKRRFGRWMVWRQTKLSGSSKTAAESWQAANKVSGASIKVLGSRTAPITLIKDITKIGILGYKLS